MNKQNMNMKRAARGVGLIEVLVALVVLAVGALAIISMQITGKQANYDAVQRTTAAQLASDLIERVRSNPLGANGYLTGQVLGGGTIGAPNPTCTQADTCQPIDMALADLYDWERLLDGQTETRTVGSVTTQTGGLVAPKACLIGPIGGTAGTYELALVWRGTQPVDATALGGTFCGGGLDGTDDYGSDAAPTNDEFRRVVRVTFFLTM